jgi:putative transposase
MTKNRQKYDEDFKRNAVKLSYASPKTVTEIAEDLGIYVNLLYNRRRKYTTYIRTDEGFMYHCVIRDIVTKDVLGDCMADRMTKELVINAIPAMTARHEMEEGCIFHSDRGSRYTSKAVMSLLAQLDFRQSFSRVGMPGDNSRSESFFATMKKEMVHRTHFRTKAEARAAVFDYIYCFYNVTGTQKSLGYMSPRDYVKTLETGELEEVA